MVNAGYSESATAREILLCFCDLLPEKPTPKNENPVQRPGLAERLFKGI
jgi:hypothetical protein